ncbi:MAG: hypothetical protein ACM3IH_16290 [Sphingobacteriales bacterium]|jgi:hypothetical protein
MKYQNCAVVAQASDESLDIDAGLRLSDANINPATGLATDDLNRFNEAVMLIELPGIPQRFFGLAADELPRALSCVALQNAQSGHRRL